MKIIYNTMGCFLFFGILSSLLFSPNPIKAAVNTEEVPAYVSAGLNDYAKFGYETAVHTWLKGSAYESGAQLASRVAFFKNIEMLAGAYLSYTVLFTMETESSNQVYVRLNYERLPGFVLFTSTKKNNTWVLSAVKLDRIQKYGFGG